MIINTLGNGSGYVDITVSIFNGVLSTPLAY